METHRMADEIRSLRAKKAAASAMFTALELIGVLAKDAIDMNDASALEVIESVAEAALSKARGE